MPCIESGFLNSTLLYNNQNGPYMFAELQTSKKSSNCFGFQFHLKGTVGKLPDDYLTRQIAFDKAYDIYITYTESVLENIPDMVL